MAIALRRSGAGIRQLHVSDVIAMIQPAYLTRIQRIPRSLPSRFSVEALLGLLPLISTAIATTTALQLYFIPAANAQTAVVNLSSQTAQGTYDSNVYRISLGTTQGVNLSFIRTGETIQKVWLDDPSRIVIDFDGCLSPAAASAIGNSCGTFNGATLIHIRQLRRAIELPTELTTGNGRSSLLTVMTNSSSGTKVYQFQLALGSGMPPYSMVEVVLSSPPSSTQIQNVSDEIRTRILSQLKDGLAVAQTQGLLDTQSPAYTQALNLIALLQSGTKFEDAMVQSGVPRPLINRLRSLGASRSPASSIPSSRPASPQQMAPASLPPSSPQSMPAH